MSDKKNAVEAKQSVPKLSVQERANLLTGRHKIDIRKQYGLPGAGWHYYWVNLDGPNGSNVDKYEEVGYTKCLDKSGHDIRRKGQSLGLAQILMRIPLEEYEKIQYHKLDEPREIERSIGRKDIRHLSENDIYGEVQITPEVIVK